jgi:opacity protein-like surface antigen
MAMKNSNSRVRLAVAAALLAGAAGSASAADDVAALQARLAQMEQQMAALKAELARVAQAAPAQEQKVQEIETRVAKVEQAAPAAAPKKGNRVFFRGGYASMVDDRSNGAFTDMNDISGALGAAGLPSVKNGQDDGWYFGAGFDFLLSDNVFGLLPGTWALAELGLEFRDLGAEEVHVVGPVAECLLLNEVLAGGLPGAVNCTGIRGQENLMMLTVSAAPKLKFNEGGKFRPWIIPAGLDLNVISPPSDSTNYLDIGVQFAGGVDYEVIPGITIGADVRYHLSADLTDPDYNAAALQAASNAGLTLNPDNNLDTWTAGVSLGIAF